MPNHEEIVTHICGTLQPFVKNDLIVSEETELVTALGLDSIKIMEVVEQIEDEFDVSVPLNILPQVRTVRDLSVQLQDIINGGS